MTTLIVSIYLSIHPLICLSFYLSIKPAAGDDGVCLVVRLVVGVVDPGLETGGGASLQRAQLPNK